MIAGWISDFSCVNALLVTNLAIFFSGVSTLVLPFCTSYGAFATIALLFGFFVAAYISLTSIVLVDLLGLDNLTSAFGLLVLFRGVSSMVSYTTFSKLYGKIFSCLSRLDLVNRLNLVNVVVSCIAIAHHR